MTRIPAPCVLHSSLALAMAGLSGCALFEDIGGGDLDDALELVPGEADYVQFVHREAMAERLGIDDIEHGASKKETERYVETLLDEHGLTGVTDVRARTSTTMSQNAAFSELDIVWEATASGTFRDRGAAAAPTR